MELKKITENISYLPASTKPLSCDIVFIKTNKATWIFDVGLNSQSVEAIKSVEGPKNVVISHFHIDHTMNLVKVKYDNLYVSANTKKYTLAGTVVKGSMDFDEEPAIKIIEFPSSHAKGCLALICGEYAFLGDGTYCKPVHHHHTYNVQLLQSMIEVMKKLDVKYFCLSHSENFIQNKEDVVTLYKEIYKRKEPDNPVISVEDYFNEDGSVKKGGKNEEEQKA